MFQRWYNNGDQKCFHGGHAPLALLAIAVLFGCLALFVAIAVIIIFKEDCVISKENCVILKKDCVIFKKEGDSVLVCMHTYRHMYVHVHLYNNTIMYAMCAFVCNAVEAHCCIVY